MPFLRPLFLLLALLLLPLPAAGTAPPSHALSPEDLEPFLDGLVPTQLEREDMAGAVITVVKDGRVILAKGYGWADVKAGIPVQADRTLFRPGSISKLFTWTAVMQLWEQGRLDLDRDVNAYLDFHLPGPPVTLRHLLTHTAGFEETMRDLIHEDPAPLQPLGAYLRTHAPRRIAWPGTLPAYSNYGASLAGHVVARVAGMPFEDYLEQHVLRPLGMEHSTFRQPVPPSLKGLLSRGYDRGRREARPFELCQVGPAGALSATGADMGRFMIAHLQEGRWEATRILEPGTARRMHARAFAPDPRLNAMALGFYEESRNGRRILGHGGDTVWFHSDLHLMPAEGVGFFVSYNSKGLGQVSSRGWLFQHFLDRYFPGGPVPERIRVGGASRDIAAVSGCYLSSRREDSTFMRAFAESVQVRGNADGTLSLDNAKFPGGELRRFEETGPLFFQEVGGSRSLAFRKGPAGRWCLQEDWPAVTFEKGGFLDTPAVGNALLGFAVGVWLLTLLAWPLGAWMRRRHGVRILWEPQALRLRRALFAACFLNLAFWGSFLGVVCAFSEPFDLGRMAPWMRGVQTLGVLGALGGLVALWEAGRAWTTPGAGLGLRGHRTLVALACLAGFVLAWNHRLLTFNLHF